MGESHPYNWKPDILRAPDVSHCAEYYEMAELTARVHERTKKAHLEIIGAFLEKERLERERRDKLTSEERQREDDEKRRQILISVERDIRNAKVENEMGPIMRRAREAAEKGLYIDRILGRQESD